jgi:outer membrane lipoprotein carrier protein
MSFARLDRCLLACCLCLLIAPMMPGWAAPAEFDAPRSAQTSGKAVEFLRRFVRETRSLEADFTQTTRQGARPPQQATGHLALQKPGRFRWEVMLPARQLIVGDGKKVWLFDEDLNQVTVKKMDAAISSAPAALLAGHGDLAQFELMEEGEEAGLLWAGAIPKQDGSGFLRLRLGFWPTTGALRAMECFDHFGQMLRFDLHAVRRNGAIPASHFRFTPPLGADVLEE